MSEQLYHALVEQSNDAIYLLILEERKFVLVNRKFLEMFAITREDVYAPEFDIMELIAPESVALIEERRWRVKSGEPVSPYYEFTGRSRSGRLISLEASVTYVRYLGQTAVQGILRDITKRKNDEKLLSRQAAELTAIADMWSSLRTANTLMDILPRILKRALAIVGGKAGVLFLKETETGHLNMRGVYPSQFLLADFQQTARRAAHQVAQTGKVLMEPSSAEAEGMMGLPLQVREKMIGVMVITFSRAASTSPAEVNVLTTVSEIAASALDRVMVLETLEQRVVDRTRELAQANERLKELDRLKTQFVSEVSHELRTPVTNLGLYLELLEHGRPENYERYLTVLKSQKARLEELIQSILELTRLDLGKEKLTFTPVDLNVLVTQVVTTYQPRAEAAGLSFTFEPDLSLPKITGVHSQLIDLITHLITNAISYTPIGQIRLTTMTTSNSKWVCLTIQDTGMGIEKEDMPHLFERFYRGQRVSQLNVPGTGLGLSIIKEIVDLHEGRIEVFSRVDVGTTFQIWLPVNRN